MERRFSSRWEAVAKVLLYCDEAEFYDNDNGFVKVAEYRNGEFRTVGTHFPNWIMDLQTVLKPRPTFDQQKLGKTEQLV